ncbi:MAG: GNAT family N-acetyltransferase [Thermoproteota archaeon]|nr:GNAT family N-acetyltransferase [Candidatus Brockarchaeota archaeon]
MDITVKESRDPDKIARLFEQHKDTPFTYLTNIQLVKMLSQLESFKMFVAEVNGEIVGCIHSTSYIYDCGYIGGLLVHKDFRGKGVGRRLLNAALNSLKTRYVYLFVEEKNTIAVRLVEKTGFKKIYKGRRYIITTPINEAFPRSPTITTDVDWLSLKESIGFNERNGVVNIGYYPVKVTEKTFEDLRVDNKILRCGNVIAIIEYSYGVTVGNHLYTFNDHIVRKLRGIDMTGRVVEVNPFYIEPRPEDLVRIVNYLLSTGEVYVKTYEGDPVANRLPLTGRTGALVMEYEKRNFSSV